MCKVGRRHLRRTACRIDAINDASGHADNSCSLRHVTEDHATRSHLRVVANCNIAKDDSLSADKHARSYFRVPVAGHFSSAAQSDAMKNRYVVANFRRFANDKTGRVVNQDTVSKHGGGVNVYRVNFACRPVNITGELLSVSLPKMMTNTVGRESEKSFRIQKDVQEVLIGGIILEAEYQVPRGALRNVRLAL